MRVLVPVLLMIAYLFSTVGLQVGIHQCGKEESYSFYGIRHNSPCACDHGDEHHDDSHCCTDKRVQIKGDQTDKTIRKCFTDEDQYTAVLISSDAIIYSNPVRKLPDFNNKPFTRYSCGLPPPYYILYCNIRV